MRKTRFMGIATVQNSKGHTKEKPVKAFSWIKRNYCLPNPHIDDHLEITLQSAHINRSSRSLFVKFQFIDDRNIFLSEVMWSDTERED